MHHSHPHTMTTPAFKPTLLAAATLAVATLSASANPHPNIILILADDMGLGDVSAYNPRSAWQTPNIDRLAREGMRFTDAHSTASVCTPSRYSILTGRYNWRSARKRGVGGALDKPLIEPTRPTIATLLKQNGYTTAMIGKWHLGIDWPRTNSATPAQTNPKSQNPKSQKNPKSQISNPKKNLTQSTIVDYTRPFAGGPTAHGFDTFLGLGTSAGAPPYIWLIDDHVDPASFPLRQTEGPQNDPQRHWPPGATGNNFEQADMLPRLTKEAVRYIQSHAAADAAAVHSSRFTVHGSQAASENTVARQRQTVNREPETVNCGGSAAAPFFLYLALTAPHTPILPAPEFTGLTHTTPYGDFCAQLDATIGQVLDALDAAGLAENTLVIFTADNGFAPNADLPALAKHHHDPNLGYRGAKADIYEGGHRLPFIARWPGRILANTTTDELICQTDLYATFADIVSAKIPDTAAEDSVSILPVLLSGSAEFPLGPNAKKNLGAPRKPAPDPATPLPERAIVHHSDNGSFAIRQGPWKLCLCPDSGGWADPRPSTTPPDAPPFQLYNLADDPAEKTNLYSAHPEIVQRLGALLAQYIRAGRSTPGPPQKNTPPETWPQLAWMKNFEDSE